MKETELYRLFLNKEKLFVDCLTGALDQCLEPAQFLMILAGDEQEADFPALVRQAVRNWYFSLPAQSARLLMQGTLSDNKIWSKLAFSRIDKTISILSRRIEKEIHLSKAIAFGAANSLVLALFQYKVSRPMLTHSEKERETVESMIHYWFRGLPNHDNRR